MTNESHSNDDTQAGAGRCCSPFAGITFAGVAIFAIVSIAAMAGLVQNARTNLAAERMGGEHEIHTAKRVAAEAVLQGRGAVEDSTGNYRIGIEAGIAALAAKPEYLNNHPLGWETPRIQPPPPPAEFAEGSGEGEEGEAAGEEEASAGRGRPGIDLE